MDADGFLQIRLRGFIGHSQWSSHPQVNQGGFIYDWHLQTKQEYCVAFLPRGTFDRFFIYGSHMASNHFERTLFDLIRERHDEGCSIDDIVVRLTADSVGSPRVVSYLLRHEESKVKADYFKITPNFGMF